MYVPCVLLIFLSTAMAGKTALIILAHGAEEMEAIITADVLRRAGVTVTLAGLLGTDPIVCSRQVKIVPDAAFEQVKDQQFDAVILPGGQPGSNTLAESSSVGAVLSSQWKRGGVVAAICAAPIALASHGIAKGANVTSYPSMEQRMRDAGYVYSQTEVVVDGQLVTSRGPGTAFPFALALVEKLLGKEKRDDVAKPMLVQ